MLQHTSSEVNGYNCYKHFKNTKIKRGTGDKKIVNFMVLSILGLFLIILAGLSLSFHTKTVLTALKDRK